MAFREGNSPHWHKITPNIAHAERLVEVIKNEQLMTKGPQALNILANDGSVLQLRTDTLCVHGDNPESVAAVQRIREALGPLAS